MNSKIDVLEKEVNTLKESINQMITTLQATEELVKELSAINQIKGHAILEEGEKLYNCEACDYSCKKEETLKKHGKTKHPEGKYKCDKSYKSFNRKDMLIRHTNKAHKENLESVVVLDAEKCI